MNIFFHMAMSFDTRNLGRVTLLMIGAVAAVAGIMLFIVLTHHGPAVMHHFVAKPKTIAP
ncbi:MAG: hypothetical protein WAK17_29525 [Candidatus Nitrosopolaris sp.]|jgi:hypothetical protein